MPENPTLVTGIEKLYYALLITDTLTSLIYDTPVYLKAVQEIGVKPKTSKEPLYAENILWQQEITFDSADVSILLASLTSAERAVLLGQTTAAIGGVYASQEDEPPYVALLYKATISGGAYRYGVLYKGMFSLFDETMKSKEGKTVFSAPSIAATFQPVIHGNADSKHLWEYHVDTTDPNCPADIATTWFTAVTIPTADTTPPTVTVAPLDAATGVAKAANIVWTFSEKIDPTKVTAANFILMQNDGTLVPGALALDATGMIVTLDPTSNMTGTTDYIAICTTGVCDLSGNYLAATSVSNFTTAA